MATGRGYTASLLWTSFVRNEGESWKTSRFDVILAIFAETAYLTIQARP